MPETPYVYSIAADIVSGALNSDRLVLEISNSAIVTALARLEMDGDTLSVVFTDALSPGDKTLLDGDSTGPSGGLIGGHDSSSFLQFPVSSSADPSTADDELKGARPGSRWVNTTDREEFVCVKADTGTALWKRTTPGRVYDAVVAAVGGDYTSVAAAFAAGHKSVFVRSGIYYETADVVLPHGALLKGDRAGETVVALVGGTNQVKADGSGGTKETAGTVSTTTDSTTVTGSGTTFTNLSAGDYILLNDVFHEIASDPTVDTSLELAVAYRGAALSGINYMAQTMHSGVRIETIAIGAGSSGFGLHLRACRHAVLEGVAIESCANGLCMEDSAGIVIEGCLFAHNTTTGVEIKSGNSVQLNGVEISNNGGIGLLINGSSDPVFVDDCLVTANGINGIDVDETADHVTLADSTITDNDDKGIHTASTTGACIMDTCLIRNNGGDGIDFAGAENTVSACTITDNGGDGVQAGARGVVTGNHIINNGAHGINMIGKADCCVSGNIVRNNTLHGIVVNGSGNVVTSNRVKDNGSDGIHLQAGATNNVIGANRITGHTTDFDNLGTGTVMYGGQS